MQPGTHTPMHTHHQAMVLPTSSDTTTDMTQTVENGPLHDCLLEEMMKENRLKIVGAMCEVDLARAHHGVFDRRNDRLRGGKYEGMIRNGVPEGWGVLRITSSSNRHVSLNAKRYEGEWRGGLFHGDGIKYYGGAGDLINKKEYDGQWNHGRRNGEGTAYFPNGNPHFECHWKDDQIDDSKEVIEYYDNGSVRYEGQMLFGLRCGYGTEYVTGDYRNHHSALSGRNVAPRKVYVGCWARGKKEGSGTLFYEDGCTPWYEGRWMDGERHGHGVEYDGRTSCKKFEGEWSKGMRNGPGTTYYPNGKPHLKCHWKDDQIDESEEVIEHFYNGKVKYQGGFLDGLKHGQGIEYNDDRCRLSRDYRDHHSALRGLTLAHHKAYEGGWSKGKKEGQGTVFYGDGCTVWYQGEWADGQRHGYGIEYDHETGGKKFEGEWHAGSFVSGTFWRYGNKGKLVGQGQWKNGMRHADYRLPTFSRHNAHPSTGPFTAPTFTRTQSTQTASRVPAPAAAAGQGKKRKRDVVEMEDQEHQEREEAAMETGDSPNSRRILPRPDAGEGISALTSRRILRGEKLYQFAKSLLDEQRDIDRRRLEQMADPQRKRKRKRQTKEREDDQGEKPGAMRRGVHWHPRGYYHLVVGTIDPAQMPSHQVTQMLQDARKEGNNVGRQSGTYQIIKPFRPSELTVDGLRQAFREAIGVRDQQRRTEWDDWEDSTEVSLLPAPRPPLSFADKA